MAIVEPPAAKGIHPAKTGINRAGTGVVVLGRDQAPKSTESAEYAASELIYARTGRHSRSRLSVASLAGR